MWRRFGYLLATCTLALRAETAQQIFNTIREHVTQQLQQSKNYTCVQTTEREYYVDHGRRPACVSSGTLSRELVMEDRLRLDVAVSNAGEIFGWHGAPAFSSSSEKIDELVRNGPISSGSFTGYLRNIFLLNGVRIEYVRPSAANQPFTFRYSVPVDASGQFVAVGKKRVQVAFHGEFTADLASRELLTLRVVLDNLPSRGTICSSSTLINYQSVDISGTTARIPGRFALEMDDNTGVHTVSQTNYQACRAFRGESSVSFEPAQAEPTPQPSKPPDVTTLPAGITLPLSLTTRIDDRAAFAGDPVSGVLTQTVRAGKITIPKGAVADGVIVLLQHRLLPQSTWELQVRFFAIHAGNRLLLTDAHQVNSALTWRSPHLPSSPELMIGEWRTTAAIR